MAITAIKKITKIKSTKDLRIIAAKKEKKEAKEAAAETVSEHESLKSSALLSEMASLSTDKLTENGAYAHSSTKNPLLDFFGRCGALRKRRTEDVLRLFMAAFDYDETHAMKALFYTRDIRGGQGERRTFRTIIRHLANSHPDAIARNIELIPEYGRFDDLYEFVGTPLEDLAFSVIAKQWNADAEALAAGQYTKVSLLAKWLKSENASSRKTKELAKLTYEHLDMSPKEYRQSLTAFRSVIHIVETAMSSGRWDSIDYSKLPSLAHKKYRAAFARHDEDGYKSYLESLKQGKTKINASTLYPYDLVKAYTQKGYYLSESKVNETVEAQWKALPNYITGDDSFLVMVDTSGSMYPDAICSSVGLGIYFAERAKGIFKNHFITFSDNPRLVEIPHGANSTLQDKILKVLDPNYVGYSTNLEAAFDMLLKAAIKGKVPQSDMPRAIVAISDMEIDAAYPCPCKYGESSNPTDFTTLMEEKFKKAGYKMPTLVYWNVEARQDTFHAEQNDNVRFVSGQSASTFKTLCEDCDSFDAVALMLRVLDGERYGGIR